MRFDLTALARRAKNPRRKSITLRDIVPPATLASDLFGAGYKPVLALVSQYAERLNAEYARTLSTIQTDSAEDLTSILSQMANELSRLVIMLTPGLRAWGVKTEKWQRSRWSAAVLSATNVSLDTMLGPEDVAQPLATTLAWNTALVRDIGEQARKKMADAIFAGLTARTPARDVAKQVQEATGFARARSLRVASDQISKLSASLASERRRQAGLKTWTWKHGFKKHPREWHQARNDNIYSEDPDMIGKTVDGKVVMQPPESSDLPGIPPYCSCRELSVLVFD